MLAVHFGAGNIGRGFVGQLLSEAGYRVIFADVQEDVVKVLKERGGYEVILADEVEERVKVENVTALHSADEADELTKRIAGADLVTTAVGPSVLAAIAPAIAKGLLERAKNGGDPLNVIACENIVGGSQKLREFVLENVPDEEKESVEAVSGFPNAAVDRIVPKQPAPASESESVDVLVEPFFEWVVDSSQILGDRPEIPGVTYVEDPFPYIERKLLTVNTGHSAIAYLGYARGESEIHASLEDESVREISSKALEETGTLLVSEYGFDPEEHREYREKVLARFENPMISDEVTRVGRAPMRKLGRDERFVSPALRLLDIGHEPRNLAKVIAAVLRYEDPDDKEAVELQEKVRAEGERAALAACAGIGEDHPLVDLVVEESDSAGEGSAGEGSAGEGSAG